MSERRRGQGELEHAVLRVVWTAPTPLTPAEIRDAIDPSLAYTTVLTVVSRLHDKGMLVRERDGKGHRYAPRQTEAEVAAAAMGERLHAAADRPAVLSQFVGRLSPHEAAMLRRLLDQHGDGT